MTFTQSNIMTVINLSLSELKQDETEVFLLEQTQYIMS